MQEPLHDWHSTLRALTPLDWGLALTLGYSTLAAFMRGLIRSLVSLAGLLAGLFVANLYGHTLTMHLRAWLGSPNIPGVVAFVLIWLSVYILMALLGSFLRGASHAMGLGLLDRLAGAAFGLLRGIALLAALALPCAPYIQDFAWARSSVFLPYLLDAAHGVSFVLPRNLADHPAATIRPGRA